MNGLIFLQGVGIVLCVIGAVIGMPATLDLAFRDGSLDQSSAVRSQRRGVMMFILGILIGALAVLAQSPGGLT